ncbi:hypothetical protein KZX46_08480 [Polymorphobacter sp. PAMC 29334]|uniref:Wzz/FepE/Etk N-terminal domain-containing protein n=1 Tax=Polymorphobacter sp. PAMC 29334 TaxID=2862331 RepID=UPI001C78949B|nr:Wzz/FepE/Etk N-terminal domain-containing protein [Polymorphobacter sp. PAMC 29334]QYE35960.1 hypothetical protein KZX46_08480 [Polymorphobacter sp. PAMC 29334]
MSEQIPVQPPIASLVNFFHAVRRGWWIILIFTVAGTAVALGVAYILPVTYRADVLLQPADDETPKALGGLAAQFGVGLPNDSKAAEAQAILESKEFTIEFIQRGNLMPLLFDNIWDPAKQRWMVTDPRKIPTPLDGYRKFRDSIRQVTRDRTTGQVLLAIEWKDGEHAAAWANAMVAQLNETVRQRALREANESLRYLRVAYGDTTLTDVRTAVLSLMASELNKAMLANVRTDYAFRVLDPAIVPNRREKPNRVLIAAAGLAIGLALGVIIALLVDANRRPLLRD